MVRWRKLQYPKAWKPTQPGDELVGFYLGQSVREGKFGQYNVVLIAVPDDNGVSAWPFYASGASLVNALDAAMVQTGVLLRVVYQGIKPLSDDRELKLFDVYVAEDSVSPEEAREYLRDAESHWS